MRFSMLTKFGHDHYKNPKNITKKKTTEEANTHVSSDGKALCPMMAAYYMPNLSPFGLGSFFFFSSPTPQTSYPTLVRLITGLAQQYIKGLQQ